MWLFPSFNTSQLHLSDDEFARLKDNVGTILETFFPSAIEELNEAIVELVTSMVRHAAKGCREKTVLDKEVISKSKALMVSGRADIFARRQLRPGDSKKIKSSWPLRRRRGAETREPE